MLGTTLEILKRKNVSCLTTCRSKSVGVSIDPDALAFLNAASIADPTISNSIDTLVKSLKANGIWTKMKAIYPMVGGTASAHKWNLKDPRDLDAAFRLTFSGGITHSSNGVLPNGTNGFANSYLQPSSVLTENSTHFSFYSRTNVSAMEVEMCSDSGFTTDRLMLLISYLGNLYSHNYNYSTAQIITPNSDTRGLHITTRTSSNSHKVFKNGIQLGSRVTGASGTIANLLRNVHLFTLHSMTNTLFSSKQCAFASIGDGLTDTEVTKLNTAVNIFQTSLSRQI